MEVNDTINTQTLYRNRTIKPSRGSSQDAEKLDDIIDDVTAEHTAAVDPTRLLGIVIITEAQYK